MRAGGFNWAAVIAAAVAIYAIGFIIYGLLIPPDRWMAMEGISQAEMESVGQSRMIFGPLMPILTAIFLAVILQWGGVSTVSTGVRWAVAIAFASAIPTLLYGWVYGVGPIEATMIDIGHLLLGHAAAGAILGGWR
jgi:hypothetical protein